MAAKKPAVPSMDAITAFHKENYEALVQANKILLKGFEELSKEVVSLTKSSLESAAAASKAVMAVKTLKDAMELNTDFTKSAMEKLVADATKLGEMGTKVSNDAFAPVSARMNIAVEKLLH